MAIIVLKKQITEEHEVDFPVYFKDNMHSFTAVYSETEKTSVCLIRGYTSVTKTQGIDVRFAELFDISQNSRVDSSEFEDAYHEAMGILSESLPVSLQIA